MVREKIRASHIIARLEKHVDGEVEMSSTQIQASKILLDKCLSNAPDIKEISGPDGGDIPARIVIELVRA